MCINVLILFYYKVMIVCYYLLLGELCVFWVFCLLYVFDILFCEKIYKSLSVYIILFKNRLYI